MGIIIAALFVVQQRFFYWLAGAKGATTASALPRKPDYDSLLQELTMGTYTFGTYPASWSRHITPTKDPKATATPAKPKTSQPDDNRQPDPVMQKRHKDSGSPSLNAMMGVYINKVPKAGKEEMCLAWTLQGKCRTGCPRKSNHRPLGAAAASTLHDFLNLCGVSAPRP